MKIYRVIYKSILMDEGEDLVEVKTFFRQKSSSRLH